VKEAILVQNLGKRFRRYQADRPWTFQDMVLRGFQGLRPREYFWALEDVSFAVQAGTMVGVIGRNGAGKSTLLRLIGGVGKSERGSIHLNGKVGALIELGAGFHPELTGRENLFINGIISGLTRREVQSRLDEIVQFAELEEFIDSPLRTYSTGMQMRLAFSIAVHIYTDILLVDEVLAVGDLAFQRKCLERIESMKKQGCAILLVSHDSGLVSQLCEEALWLEAGRLAAYGSAQTVVERFMQSIHFETKRRTPQGIGPRQLPDGTLLQVHENRFGSLEVELANVRFTGREGQPPLTLESGAALKIEMEYSAPHAVEAPIFGVALSREDGFIVYETSVSAEDLGVSTLQGRGKVTLCIDRLDLVGGQYFVDVGVYQKDWDYAFDYHWHAYSITLTGNQGSKGLLLPPQHWEHHR
jgi:lipopolysaccharide transport system ATP-binding protein